tara:strand:- start:545 stop:727 length:183 start_codon:yes stop_codon:yes gene_type:complete
MVELVCLLAIMLIVEIGYYVLLLIQKEVRHRNYEKQVHEEQMSQAMSPSALINQEHNLFF